MKIIKADFDPKKNEPHFNWFALCLSCQNKWIATCHVATSLFKLECPKCGEFNSFCSEIRQEYSDAIIETNNEGVYHEPEIQEEKDQ